MAKDTEFVLQALKARGQTIAFAESCTGGLAVARLVDIPDASQVLNASFVTYANEAKTALVGVDPQTLAQCGAVSEEVAGQMAAGAAKAAQAEVGVGISGIAGPGGGTPEKPVGTVCFGFSISGALHTETMHFSERERAAVRRAAVNHVYARLKQLLT